jgi:hypothetical protein
MIRGLVVSGTVGALLLMGTMAFGLVNLREDIGAIRNPFNEVNDALSEPVQQARAWGALSIKANSICAGYARDELVIRPSLPRSRMDYVGAIGVAVDREQAIQAELTALQAPPNYKLLYSQFLQSRQAALAELERLQKAAKAKNRKDYVLAAQALTQKKRVVGHYATAARMPACGF